MYVRPEYRLMRKYIYLVTRAFRTLNIELIVVTGWGCRVGCIVFSWVKASNLSHVSSPGISSFGLAKEIIFEWNLPCSELDSWMLSYVNHSHPPTLPVGNVGRLQLLYTEDALYLVPFRCPCVQQISPDAFSCASRYLCKLRFASIA